MTEDKKDNNSNMNPIANFNPSKYKIGGQFDTASFNIDFLKVIDEQEKIAEEIEKRKLDQINAYYNNERKYGYHFKDDLSDLSISNILIKWLDTIMNILYEIIHNDGNIDDFLLIFTKENRLFYIGLTILFVVSILYLINNYLLTDRNNISLKPLLNKFIDV
jgi:hypothetical protein